MSLWSNLINSWKKSNDGFFPYFFNSVINGKPQFNDYIGDLEKLKVCLTNPAVLKVICLQADLFSLGQVYAYRKVKKENREVDNDPILKMLKNPNKMQSQSQWLWDYMFFRMMGTAYLYVDSAIVGENNLYFLNPTMMEFPTDMNRKSDKLILSNKTAKELNDFIIKYKYEDGTSIQIPFSKIIVLTDLSNGTGNWFKGNSRLDALHKIISNSEASLDAKNINIRYTGKFMVSGQQDPKDITKTPMSEVEKTDIETKINGGKQVHAVKSMIDIKRFVSDLRTLELDKQYLGDYFLIGSMYGIPRDVLEAYVSSTYENQEKARASHVSYTLQPAGNDLMQRIAQHFGYDNQNITLEIDWSHLPFMQVFEGQRADVEQKKITTFDKMLKIGIPLKEINEFLDVQFTINEQTENNSEGGVGQNQNANNNQSTEQNS